jgi:chromosome segregation ATPase
MTRIETLEQQLKKAEEEYGEAKKNLRTFEEGKYKGEKLNELEDKLERRSWQDEEEKTMWKDKVKELKEEKKSLEEKERFWRGQVEEWGKALREFGGGEGNEQIA